MAATLDRPERHTVLRSFAGHLDTAPDAAFRALTAGLAEWRPFVDRARRLAVVQGEWWYRAEYRVLPEDGGSLVEHEIVNVAPRWHALGPIAGRAELREAPFAFQLLLTAVQLATDPPAVASD